MRRKERRKAWQKQTRRGSVGMKCFGLEEYFTGKRRIL